MEFHNIGALTNEMGIDVFNPLQPRAAGMDTALIKKEFGDGCRSTRPLTSNRPCPGAHPRKCRPRYKNAAGCWARAGATSALQPITSRLTHLWRTLSPCTLRPRSFRRSDGALVDRARWPKFDHPLWMAVGPEGSIYMADSGNNASVRLPCRSESAP